MNTTRERSSMVEHELPKLDTGVRFPSLAPIALLFILFIAGCGTAPKYPPAAISAAGAGAHRAYSYGYAVPFKASKDSFAWPVKGVVISSFGSKVDRSRNKGIDILVPEGSDVRASRSGRVVFCDDKFRGFGRTVVVDHGDRYETVYAYNSAILVKVGDMVGRDTVIARSGKTGRAREASLHFEIRREGRSENPLRYLR